MSPRAAWRLEALGFEHVYDYVGGKADWLASGRPRAGRAAGEMYAGDLVDPDPPTCALADRVSDLGAALRASRYGFTLVISDRRVLLGRVRRSALSAASEEARAEDVMEPGPSTVRYDTPATELIERLAHKELRTAIVTTPTGRLVGVFDRAAAARRLA